ncbi:MAG: cytochrome c oxidase subunit 3 [Deltaproteobacteria bacterium]|nr:cytochrome c oxidase subunit 3 [Deltaproteobacteria bacterium]
MGKTGVRDDARGAAARLGMWLFIATEAFFFLAPLLLYAAYRYRYAYDFRAAGGELNLFTGAANTAVLLTSSLTMALAVNAGQRGDKRLTAVLLAATIILGSVFLVIKYFEWTAKISHGIYPNSETFSGRARGEVIFWGLYFFITGLHGLHVFIGVCLLTVMLFMRLANASGGRYPARLENCGLYWHAVDVIWIYIFPFFYLMG